MIKNFLINLFETAQDVVWGTPLIVAILFLGIYYTIKTKFFQFKYLPYILKRTIFSAFKKNKAEKGQLTPFQTLATTLSATLGTGSIAGVATAIFAGGVGAVFWMWISAFFGAAISYVENILAIYFREKNEKDQFCGGTMYCLKNGFENKSVGTVLSAAFSFCCILASFGIGNSVQTNTIVGAINGVTKSISPQIIGMVVSAVLFIIIIFGVKSIANVTSFLLPIMAVFYFIGTMIIIIKNVQMVPKMIMLIVKSAFGIDALTGALGGTMVKKAINIGIRRGIFSNEAGMGSTTIINSASNIKEPAEQGMWGIFEVYFDTLVICSLTAFALILSGLFDLHTGKLLVNLNGAELISAAFEKSLGSFAAWFILVSTIFFAFSTLLGWSFYGIRCIEFLFGERYVLLYKIIFCFASYFGAVSELGFIWIMSDVFNGIMMIPNLICICALSGVAIKISNNYINRKFLNKMEVPMLNYKN